MADIWMDVDTALTGVPVNIMPLIDDGDFKTREESVAYNATGLDLVWNFVSTAGAFTQTAVTPTDTGGSYDWVNKGNGFYAIEIPASGGASINNDAEGFGWFTGIADGVLPWRGPIIGFRAAGLNDLLIDGTYSTTRGLAGTALPAVVAGAVGGVPLSFSAGGGVNTTYQASAQLASGSMSGGYQQVVVQNIASSSYAAIQSAIGMASANLDTQLGTLATASGLATLAARFTGITSLANWLRTAWRSDSPDGGTALAEINSSGGTFDQATDSLQAQAAAPVDVDEAAIAAEVASSLGSGSVTVYSPTQTSGSKVILEIVRGDSYEGTRALSWTNAAGTWPDLTDATIRFTVRRKHREGRDEEPEVLIEATGTVVTATGENQKVSVELTSTLTAAADPGRDHQYDVEAELTGGERVTLAGPGWPAKILRDQTIDAD